jgi:hypothetical protein
MTEREEAGCTLLGCGCLLFVILIVVSPVLIWLWRMALGW